MTVSSITSNKENLNCFRSRNQCSNQITATEMIGGVRCQITLEQDASGNYREVKLTPLKKAHIITK